MREWIVTNGLGSYASLTHQNNNTRKFHGLLIASLNPPVDRWVFVSNVYDKIKINDKIINLKDFKSNFSFDYHPHFTYEINGVKIEKTILMEYEKNTTIIRYKIKTDKPVTMLHSPVVHSRHFYDINGKRYLEFEQERFKDGVSIKPSNIDKTLKIMLKDSTYNPGFHWDEFFYKKDLERNDSWIDNNAVIGEFSKTVKKSDEYYVVLTIEDEIDINPKKIFSNEQKRKKSILEQSELPKDFERLILSTDNFIVKKDKGKSVIAGYHWFSDWGRDTLISLPGLALVTKRFDDAKQILLDLSQYCKNGLIPNTFMDKSSEASYNTVDASLWYVDRVYQYLKYTNDKKFVENIWKTLESIIEGYKEGTENGIHMDDDYLISHNPGLTWMDVKLGDYYPTPRSKKAVEIQALWYNALKIMSNLSKFAGKEDNYSDLADSVKYSFNSNYDLLYDVIDIKDASCRPNKIFLVSLDYNMIDDVTQKKIVKNVQEKLVTIFGLRTLAPDEEGYIGTYIGDHNRDLSYHNGTVWPWLMGPFIKAYVKTNSYSKKHRYHAYKTFLKPMFEVFGPNWDGSIYEIFDGNPIYAPRGCINQAWSVAEILRCCVEDIENIKPQYKKILDLPEIRV